jgi:hypothetical protein
MVMPISTHPMSGRARRGASAFSVRMRRISLRHGQHGREPPRASRRYRRTSSRHLRESVARRERVVAGCLVGGDVAVAREQRHVRVRNRHGEPVAVLEDRHRHPLDVRDDGFAEVLDPAGPDQQPSELLVADRFGAARHDREQPVRDGVDVELVDVGENAPRVVELRAGCDASLLGRIASSSAFSQTSRPVVMLSVFGMAT